MMGDVLEIVAFVIWVNILPPMAEIIFGKRFRRPLDGGRSWIDGRPLFGPHKTGRGIVVSVAGGVVCSPLLGITWQDGGVAALLAMTGDLISSFIKRRMGRESGYSAVFLDQIFESLFPALYLARVLRLEPLSSAAVVAVFLPLAHFGAVVWRYLTYRPSLRNFPRLVHSPVRYREWRACHIPLARWQVMLNLTSFLSNEIILTSIFKISGLYERGRRNALQVRLEEMELAFPSLPPAFDGFRILFMSDLHLDGQDGLTEELVYLVRDVEVDLCLIGGDIRMKTYGPVSPSLRKLKNLLPRLHSRHGCLGVLGNHDCIEMAPDLEDAGMITLVNESWWIDEEDQRIWVVGVDDPHYYKVHDLKQAFANVPAGAFTIFLVHTPELYREAAGYHVSLYLCGHTHGGQICLPGGRPVLTNSRAPRFTASGRWHHEEMIGYTSRGAGASSVPLRFHCPGEVTLITLRQADPAVFDPA